jgi:hypothetical protein
MGSCGWGPAALFSRPDLEQGELEEQAGGESEREEEALLADGQGARAGAAGGA